MAPYVNQDLRSPDSLTKKYKLVKPLVQGSQASVELWSHNTTGELVAVKTNHNYTLNQQLVHTHLLNNKKLQNLKDPLSREAHILAELHQHNVPGIVPFKGIFDIPDDDMSINNSTNYGVSNPCSRKHLVLGYCDGGDLLDLVDTRPHQKLKEHEACKVIKSLVHTLRCCHALGIMHRDIKLENIFLMSKHSSNTTETSSDTGNLYNQLNNNNIHYIDTTLAENMSTNSCSLVLSPSLSKRKGTPQLIKPEASDQYYNELEDELFVDCEETKFDYQVLLGDFGVATYFEKSDDSSIQLALTDPVGSLYYMAPEVIRGMYDERADVWSIGIVLHCLLTGSYPFSDVNDNEQSLKSQILKQDLDVVGSPEYLELSSSVCDLLAQMLDKNPNTRITLEGIQNHTWLSEYTTVTNASSSSLSCKRTRKV